MSETWPGAWFEPPSRMSTSSTAGLVKYVRPLGEMMLASTMIIKLSLVLVSSRDFAQAGDAPLLVFGTVADQAADDAIAVVFQHHVGFEAGLVDRRALNGWRRPVVVVGLRNVEGLELRNALPLRERVDDGVQVQVDRLQIAPDGGRDGEREADVLFVEFGNECRRRALDHAGRNHGIFNRPQVGDV